MLSVEQTFGLFLVYVQMHTLSFIRVEKVYAYVLNLETPHTHLVTPLFPLHFTYYVNDPMENFFLGS